MTRTDFVHIAHREARQRRLSIVYGTALVALCLAIAAALWIVIT